jgi:hypothetical protein
MSTWLINHTKIVFTRLCNVYFVLSGTCIPTFSIQSNKRKRAKNLIKGMQTQLCFFQKRVRWQGCLVRFSTRHTEPYYAACTTNLADRVVR